MGLMKMSKFDRKFKDFNNEDLEHFNRDKKKKKVKWHESKEEDIKWPYGSLGEEVEEEDEKS